MFQQPKKDQNDTKLDLNDSLVLGYPNALETIVIYPLELLKNQV